MNATEFWLTPLILLPGVALLIGSTSARFGQVHIEFHHMLDHPDAHARILSRNLLERSKLFRDALASLYTSVGLFSLGSLLGGVAGVPAAKVTILGGGVSGVNAARMAIGLEARVTILDIDVARLYAIDQQFGAAIETVFSTRAAVEEHVTSADLVIEALLKHWRTVPSVHCGPRIC